MRRLADTIVAPITGLDRAAVAWVRLSGSDSWRVAERVFGAWPREPEPGRVVLGRYRHGDEGFALPFAAGRSYTGEESVELSVHGSRQSVKRLVEACLEAGARLADPGEFTQRAFLSGKLDLTQAEGVRETVEAATDAQLRAANAMRGGRIAREVRDLRQGIVGALAAVEAATDFEEEIGPLDRRALVDRLSNVMEKLRTLLAGAKRGRMVRDGLRVVIAGRPNVGKSSLLNRLLGADRAIVTAIAGTTRDTLEEWVDLGGVPCRLIDTAGLRDASDEVEAIGIDRAKEAVASADLVWFLYEAPTGWTDADEAIRQGVAHERVVTVATKVDLVTQWTGELGISSTTGEGIEALIVDLIERADIERGSDLLINARHEPLIAETIHALERTCDGLESGTPDDLAAVGLYAAVQALGEITGETASPDLVEAIFGGFCIGK